MSTATEKSAFLRDLKKRQKELSEVAKEEQAGGFLTDEDIINMLGLDETKSGYVTKLARVRYGLDKNKSPYFAFNYTIVEGEHKGTTVSRFVGLGGRTKDDRAKGMKQLMGTFQRLDVDTTKWKANQVDVMCVETAEALTKARPNVNITLSTYDRADGSKGLSVDVQGLGTPTSSNGAAKPARSLKKEADTESTKYSAMGLDADDEGVDTHADLEALAKVHGMDPDEFDTWEKLGQALDAAEASAEADEEEAEAEEEEEGEDPAEYVD
jgi:hypothetical protein